MTIHENFPLSEIVYYKIGGKARFLLEVKSKEDVMGSFVFIRYRKSIQNILPLGIGANILISDKGFDGAIIHFKKPKTPQIKIKGDTIEVFAGHLLDDLIQFSFEHGFIGLEWAGGLPSTVGAAIRGNVGAFGGDISKTFYKAEVIDIHERQIRLQELSLSDMQFGYRDSFLKKNKNLVLVNGYFKLQKGTREQVELAKKEYKEHIKYRNMHHPMEYPSCGSVFKNITKKDEVQIITSTWPDVQNPSQTKWHGKISMGYVIDRLGFTGKQKGGAQVSTTHSNYIVNKNNASFDDVCGLINEIKESFFKTFSFYPEPEVEIIY